MEDRKTDTGTERAIQADRIRPLSLADPRRLVRQAEKPQVNGQIFSDWASI